MLLLYCKSAECDTLLLKARCMPSLQAAQLSATHNAVTSIRSGGQTQIFRPARQASLQQIQVWRPLRSETAMFAVTGYRTASMLEWGF